MQATKSSRRASEPPPHRISPATARPNGLSKAVEVDSIAGTNQPRKISSSRSQKENEQQSLCRNSVLEKRRPSQFTYLESQLGDLQKELNRTKDQLASSQSCTKRAQQEAEEATTQLLMMSSKFEDSQRKLMELSAAEDDRIFELRKISQERDKAWQSELAALQNQQSMDMAAWSSATKEIQKLNAKIEILIKSEASMAKELETATSGLQILKEEVMEKDSVIESLKIQIAESKSDEAKARERANETQLHLEKSKAIVNELDDQLTRIDENGRSLQLSSSFKLLEDEYQKEQHSANELIDKFKIAYFQTESQLESELKEANVEIADLKSKLVNKDVDLRSISDMNKKLNDEIRAQVDQVEAEFSSKMRQATIDISELKARLEDKDAALEKLSEENKLLKIEMEKNEVEEIKSCEDDIHAELRRVKLHSNQWRKAAETAAAILTAGSNGRVIERSGSLDPQSFYDGINIMHSPNINEICGESPRSRNHNMLRMIGGLWKK